MSKSSREWSQSVWLVLVGLDVRRLVNLMWLQMRVDSGSGADRGMIPLFA